MLFVLWYIQMFVCLIVIYFLVAICHGDWGWGQMEARRLYDSRGIILSAFATLSPLDVPKTNGMQRSLFIYN